MSLADATDAQHESDSAGINSGLVGVRHDAGVAQRRGFNGVLAGEYRTQQHHSLFGDLGLRIETIGEFRSMRAEDTDKVAVPPVESGDDVIQRR